jgi:hypothetical protein
VLNVKPDVGGDILCSDYMVSKIRENILGPDAQVFLH